jgi:UDP-N-acetylmuramoylalanine--D-glutamate ligase
VPLSSLMRLFFETWPGPTLGVTGTNGKFTVVTLVGAMLDAAGIPAVTSGNDRTHVPALLALDRATPDTWLLLEISNRQLVGFPYSPRVAVVTNLAPHHLDDHGSFDAYVDAKRTIVRHQRAGDVAVLNAGDPVVAGFAQATPAEIRWFDRTRPVPAGAYVRDGQVTLAGPTTAAVMPAGDLRVPGAHTVENALAAVATAAAIGVAPEAMRTVLRAFRGLPYRFRLVAEREGVAFYEDSLGTNPTSAAAAISSMTRPYYLIAGGLRKGARSEDFAPMVRAIAATPARAVYLIGATAPVLAEAIAGMAVGPAVESAGTLDAAVAAAWAAARAGEAVLLSPGCESFDQFADYRERGDRFVALVAELPARAGGRVPR